MTNLIAFNGANCWLDDRLQEHDEQMVNAHFVVYNQLLHQLHLPAEKWDYLKGTHGRILVEKQADVVLMDEIIFKNLEYSKLVSPLQLYSYYLLQQFLGNGLNYGGLGLVFERKCRIIYLDTPFDLGCFSRCDFSPNDLSQFMLKRARKEDLLHEHETFFVLLAAYIKDKILVALTRYQAETGHLWDKNEFLETLLNPERLNLLKSFSKKLIDRK